MVKTGDKCNICEIGHALPSLYCDHCNSYLGSEALLPSTQGSTDLGEPEAVAESVQATGQMALYELVQHCWIHSNYKNCGFLQMTREQKELYGSIIGHHEDSDWWNEYRDHSVSDGGRSPAPSVSASPDSVPSQESAPLSETSPLTCSCRGAESCDICDAQPLVPETPASSQGRWTLQESLRQKGIGHIMQGGDYICSELDYSKADRIVTAHNASLKDDSVLRQAVQVAVAQLYATHPTDVTRRFTLDELTTIVDATEALRPRQVEDIYHEALYGK